MATTTIKTIILFHRIFKFMFLALKCTTTLSDRVHSCKNLCLSSPKSILNFFLKFFYSHPLVSMGQWEHNLAKKQNPRILKYNLISKL